MTEPAPHRHWVLPCPECTGTGLCVVGGHSRGVGFTVGHQCPVCEGSRYVRVPAGRPTARLSRAARHW